MDEKGIQEIKDKTNTINYFVQHLGAHLDVLTQGHAEFSLKLEKCHKNYNGMTHGGVMLTLMDAAIGAASRTCGGRMVTLESKTNFLKGIKVEGQTIKAVADVIRNGRTIIVAESKVYDGDALACISTATMYITDP